MLFSVRVISERSLLMITTRKEFRDYKWGDIYLYDFGNEEGSIEHGIRPAMIISSNGLNARSTTVVVAAITTSNKEIDCHVFLGKRFKLIEESTLLLEQVRTVNKADLVEYIGHVNDESMIIKIRRGIRFAFGLPVKKFPQKGTIMNLCDNCRQSYYDDPGYIIRRLDHFNNDKDECSKCHGGYGYEYIVIHKRQACDR